MVKHSEIQRYMIYYVMDAELSIPLHSIYCISSMWITETRSMKAWRITGHKHANGFTCHKKDKHDTNTE